MSKLEKDRIWDIEATNDSTEGYTSSDQDKINKGDAKPDNIKRFELITSQMALLFAKKNKDYGNSFDIAMDEDGLLAAKIRLGDKYRRFSQLIKYRAEVKTESTRDTLIDMANYAIMTVMWMDLQEEIEQFKKMQECEKKNTIYADGIAVGNIAVNLDDITDSIRYPLEAEARRARLL